MVCCSLRSGSPVDDVGGELAQPDSNLAAELDEAPAQLREGRGNSLPVAQAVRELVPHRGPRLTDLPAAGGGDGPAA
jgi:hypothetical protein